MAAEVTKEMNAIRFQLLTAASMKFRVFWDVAPCSHDEVASIIIAMMMEAVRTSEMSVNFNMTTWRYIPEDSQLHELY
jgi:hypothetical protein